MQIITLKSIGYDNYNDMEIFKGDNSKFYALQHINTQYEEYKQFCNYDRLHNAPIEQIECETTFMIGSKTYLQKKLNANFWGVFYKLKGGGV
jgi:hypothetical protein